MNYTLTMHYHGYWKYGNLNLHNFKIKPFFKLIFHFF
jgi:hypothetical protein